MASRMGRCGVQPEVFLLGAWLETGTAPNLLLLHQRATGRALWPITCNNDVGQMAHGTCRPHGMHTDPACHSTRLIHTPYNLKEFKLTRLEFQSGSCVYVGDGVSRDAWPEKIPSCNQHCSALPWTIPMRVTLSLLMCCCRPDESPAKCGRAHEARRRLRCQYTWLALLCSYI